MKTLRTWLVTNPLGMLIFLGFFLHGRVARPASLHDIGRNWSRRMLAVAGVRVETAGLDHAIRSEPCVLVANHLSLLDTPLLYAFLPVEFRFIAKESLFKVPIIGAHLRKGGHISLFREDGRSAVRSLEEASRILREEKKSVLVFAEGTRASEGQGLRSFKTGAAHLAIQAGAPVVPVAIQGTAELLPRNSFAIRSGGASLSIGAPIATVGMSRKDRESLTTRLQTEVARLLATPERPGEPSGVA
jgi:1-acyl-sn-glycerol-3-phosphate acyltransferase